jgi:hypothetical protein
MGSAGKRSGRVTGKPEIMPDCGTNFRLADKPPAIPFSAETHAATWLFSDVATGTGVTSSVGASMIPAPLHFSDLKETDHAQVCRRVQHICLLRVGEAEDNARRFSDDRRGFVYARPAINDNKC